MRFLKLPSILALTVASVLTLPLQTQAHDHHDHGDYRYYGRRYYGGRYYAPGYYYWGDPYRYYGPTISFSVGPRYYSSYSSRSDDTPYAVQSALRRRGYYHGSIDGDIGPGTRSAIRTYQSDRGLPVTGQIDGRLLNSLGL